MEDTAARPETTAVISTFPLIRRRPILSYGTGMQHKHSLNAHADVLQIRASSVAG